MTKLSWTDERIVDAVLDPNPSVRLDGLKAMSDMLTTEFATMSARIAILEAALTTKDAQIAMQEWALATLAAERKAEVAELEAIKASLAAKAAGEAT